MSGLKPIVAVPLRFGLYAGGISIFLFFVLYLLGYNPLIIYRNFDFSFILLPIFIYFSIKEFRDFNNDNALEFWQGMSVGFFTYVTIAALSGLFLFLFLEVGDPQLLTGYVADRIQILDDKKEEVVERLGEIAYNKTYSELKMVTAFHLALDDFLKKLFIGLFLTIIISVLLRRKPSKIY